MRDDHQLGYTPLVVPGVTAEERVEVHSRHVPCDGGKGVLGHPLIWMRIEGREVTCPYCSRTFVLAPGAGDEGGH